MYFRVFSLNDATPDLAAMLEHLHAAGLPAIAHFRGDDLGWTGGDLILETIGHRRTLSDQGG